MIKQRITSLDELSLHSKAFLEHISSDRREGALVVALIGNLGAGKTAWVKTLAKHLGVKEEVTSPTFVIQKNYQTTDSTFAKLSHIDAYRLEKRDDLENIGWNKLVSDPTTLICIEWPSQVEGLVPEHAHKIHFTFIDEKTREIEVYYANE